MKRLLSIFPAFIAIITILLTPVTTARANLLEGTKLTIRKENEMGRTFDTILRSQMSMVGDTYITDYVDDLVQRVVKAKKPMPFRIKSAVVANPILNAFAIPGGYIYVFTGLIQEVTSESQLVGVIAHELAHVSQRHVASRLEKQSKVGMLSMAGMLAGIFLGVAGGKGTGQAASALIMGSQGAATAAMLQYSQDDEREADHVGLNSLVKAGYNPEGMPQTFEIMLKNRWFDSGSEVPTYLSTHPGLTERITYLNDRIKRMPATFTEREDDNTTLKMIQPLIRSKMSSATTAMAYFESKPKDEYSAMDYVGLGIVQQRLKDIDGAAISFRKALEMDRKSPLVSREAGIFYFKTGQYKEANKYIQLAVIKNRRDALGLFYLSRLQAETDHLDRAIKTMRTVNEIVPEDSEVHYYLGKFLGESGDAFGGNLHLSYASIYSQNMRKANYHMKQAEKFADSDAQQTELKQLKSLIIERTAPEVK